MNEQYFHQTGFYKNGIKKEYTVYLEVPSQNILMQLMEIPTWVSKREIDLKVGLAKVNPKDQYVKKIGRQVAKSKAEYQTFKLLNAAYNGENVEILLSSGKIDVVLVLNLNFKKAHFVHASTTL